MTNNRRYQEAYEGITLLAGETIRAIWIDGDEQHYMAFDTDNGRLCLFAAGDCCSESWFYHIIGVRALIGHTVTMVEEVAVELPDAYSRQTEDKIYGYNLRTTGGMADIEFRNSSNGYYGGNAEKVDEIPASVRMIEVTDDYTAQLPL